MFHVPGEGVDDFWQKDLSMTVLPLNMRIRSARKMKINPNKMTQLQQHVVAILRSAKHMLKGDGPIKRNKTMITISLIDSIKLGSQARMDLTNMLCILKMIDTTKRTVRDMQS